MANNDGLSQNIELNVSVNQQSIKKAQEAVDSIGQSADVKVNLVANTADFMAELRKELGFGASAKIRVGGYSTGNSPDRTVRNKAASKIEQMGGDWSGIDIADKAEVAIAKNINEAAKELATRIGIKFVDQYAATIGEADFALPDSTGPKDKIQQLIEDFIVDAAGGVTISPAMLLAASERVYKNNPGISVPGGPAPIMSGSIKPTPALPEGAQVDEQVTRNFEKFLESAIGENPQAAAAVNDMLYKKLKVVLSKVVDAGQKAREDTFKNAGVAEGQDAAEGLVRYADNAARAAIALQEMLNGLQAGTTAAYARGVVPEKFRSRPEAVSDPANLANVLVGDYQDSVTGALMSSLPDPKKVADPIAQILLNPYILGDRFVAGYEKQVQTAIKNYGKKAPADKPAAEAPKKVAQLNTAQSAASAVMPQLDKYRPLIGDAIVDQVVKIIGEAGGDVSKITAAFDTEFIQNNTTPIYEAGITIKNSLGQFVDLLKMIHLPQGSADEVNKALTQAGAGARTVEDIKKRGAALGIPQSHMSYGGGQAQKGDLQDMEVYASKIDDINQLLRMLDELGIQVAGSNIVGADFRMLAVSVENINKILDGFRNWPELKAPILDNVVDFKKVIEQLQALQKSGNLSSELAPFIQGQLKDGVVKGANGLGELLSKAIDMQPELAKQYGVQKQGNGFSIDGMPAHVAIADNRAALIVLDFLKKFAQSAELIAKGTSILGPAYGNGTAGPYSNKTRESNPSAFGGGIAIDPADRAAAAVTLVQETNAQDENNKAVKTGIDLANKRLSDDESYKKLLGQLTDARKAYQIVNSAVDNNGVIKPADKAVLEAYIVKLDELGKESKDAATAAASLRAAIADPSKGAAFRARRDVKAVGEDTSLQMSQKAYEAENAVAEIAAKRKEQRARNYENTATQVERNLTGASNEATKAQKANTATRVISIEQEEKARKDASETIKRIYKDQVEAEKEVQAATKASINQWVTGRYALYDVGNAYQNVSTQLFRVARRIFDITKSYRDYETAFTSVERAMQLDFSDPAGGAKELKDQFIALSEVIPVAFEELSRIATLGAQMGIGAKGIVKFTETVAQFSAVTGIAADTVAQKFGKIAELTNLPSDQFDKLGSAVTFAGINAVATESEILTLSESIAAVSNQAGMSTPDVVGLGTALSSVGIPAEQARGVFTRVFADIDRAVATGGESLKAFADVSGMSVSDFSKSWGKQGKSYDVFRAMLGGINSATDLTKAFDGLGITETREVNTLTRLANNLNVVDGAMTDAAASFGDGQFLLESFSKTTDNLDSQITIFQNNLKSLGEQVGQIFGGSLKDLLKVGSAVTGVLKNMADSPVLQFLTVFSSGTIALVGILTGMTAVMAKVTAQIYAFRVAMINSANDSTAINGIGKQIKQLTNIGGGLIEVRDKLLTPNANVRGEVVPVDFSLASFISGENAKRAELLKTQNIFLASTRQQADSLQRLSLLKQHEIEVAMQGTAVSGIEADVMRKKLMAEAFYVEIVGQEASMLTQAQHAELKSAAAAEVASKVKNGEAVARLKNVQAINAETKAAVGITSGVVGFGSKIMGFLGAAGIAATVLTTVIGIVDGLSRAASEANKIDLAGSGFSVEAIKETITQDTQAWMDNGKAIGIVRGEYVTTQAGVNKYADAISFASSKSKELYSNQKSLVEVTKQQTIALGEATRTLLSNSILANEKIKQIIDSNGDIFNQLAKSGVNVAEFIDAILSGGTAPADFFKRISDEIAGIDKQIQQVTDSLNAGDGSGVVDTQTGDYVKNLGERKTALLALGEAGKEAIDQINKAVTMNKVIDMLKGYSSEFVGLEAKIKNAAKTGKGMAAALKEIAVATIATANITNKKDLLAINGAKTVEEMIKIVKALRLVEIAAKQADVRMDSFGRSALANGAIGIASQYDGVLRNLQLLADASTKSVDSVAQGSEGAAEKLKRLISEANSSAGAVTALNAALRSAGEAFKASKDWSIGTEGGAAKVSAILGVITQIGENAGKDFPKAIRELQAFQITLTQMGAPASAVQYVSNAIKKLGGDSTLTAKQVQALKSSIPAVFKNMATQLNATSSSFKSLTDYVGDLKNVLSAAFEIRYTKQSSLDAVTKSWMSMSEAAADAQKSIKSANDEIAGLNADRNILDYQLKVAQRYGDEKRAASIRAKLAKLDGDLLDANKNLTDARDASNTSLKGDSKAAIENRAKVRDLVQTYNNYLVSLANTGMSSDKLKEEAAKLAGEFLSQGQKLGFAKSELEDYTNAFKGDFTNVINSLPNEITLTVNTDPALRAIEEFVKKANSALSSVSTGVASGPNAEALAQYNSNKEAISDPFTTSRMKNDAKESIKFFEKVYGTKYATGGFVSGPGTGKSDSIPAMLSNGEFVISAGATSAYGVDFLNALNQQRVGFSPIQPQMQAQQSQASQMVYLSPEDRQLLRAAIDRPVALYTENTKIAASANAGNLLLAQRGSN